MELIRGFDYDRKLEKENGFIKHKTTHIDLIEVCPIRGSLKTYGARLHSERIQDLPFSPHKPITREQAEIVKHYCINDLDNTALIALNLKDQLTLRYELGMQYNVDLFSKSDPQVAESVISTELQRQTGTRPKRPTITMGGTHKYVPPSFISYQTPTLQKMYEVVCNSDFEVLESGAVLAPHEMRKLQFQIGKTVYRMGIGGLHSCEKTMAYKTTETHSIKDVDVSSYYPKIILNQNLFPKHLGKNFIKVYRSLYERRLIAKSEKNYAVSEGLKIAINGCFGKMGNPYSILYAPNLMLQTTLTGQLALLMLIEKFELNGISVISGNTDGAVSYCPHSQIAAMQEILKAWEKKTDFEIEENEYVGYYARDVNNYLAFKKDGSVKGKGVFLNPWNDPKLAIFRFHKNPMTTICTRAIVELIARDVPIEKTISECRDIREFVAVKNVTGGAHQNGEYLGKVVRWYYATGQYRTINKIENGNLVPESEGGKPCMDLPDMFPNDIDYNWYRMRTLRLLEDLGYYQRQHLLFT
jgi:hypothetical protein